MKNILKAVVAQFRSEPVAADVTGVFTGHAPQGVDCPYVVIVHIGGLVERTLSTPGTDRIERVQLSVYSDESTSREALEIGQKLREAFDRRHFAVDDNAHIYMLEISSRLDEDPEPDSGWAYHIDFEIRTQET